MTITTRIQALKAKSYVLRQDFKVIIESISHRLAGSVFHSVGAATLKDLSPKDIFHFPAGYKAI